MIYDTMLFLHFVGVALGAGTGVYLLALGRHAARNLDQAEARTLMPGIAGTVASVGDLGLVLLIVSGLSMGFSLGDGVLTPAFQFKLSLVVLLLIFIGSMHYLARRVRLSGDARLAQRMQRLGMLGPILGLAIIFTAVLAFH